jgi:uncharacterized membrane protein YhaH (DUF805 family)
MENHYQILGIRPDATQDEIKQAWKFCVQAFHPDKFSERQRETAEQRMKDINAAYEVLSEPIERASYDRKHAERNRPESTPPPSPRSAPPPARQKTPSSTDSGKPKGQASRPYSTKQFRGGYVTEFLLPIGRIGRSGFILRITGIILVLCAELLMLGPAVIESGGLISAWFAPASLVFIVMVMVAFIVMLVQASKRLHDCDVAGYWLFPGIASAGVILLPFLLLNPGTNGQNRFGTRKPTTRFSKIAAPIVCGLWLVAFTIFLVVDSQNSKSKSPRYVSAPMTASSPLGSQRHVCRVINVPCGGELSVRAEAAASSPIVAKLRVGDHVYLEDGRMRNGTTIWQKVTGFNGYIGWVNADYLSLEK